MPIRPAIGIKYLSMDGRQCVITEALGKIGVSGFIAHETRPLWHATVWNWEGENQEQSTWDLKEEWTNDARDKKDRS